MRPIHFDRIKRILVSRIDRIGDVVLSTPVFQAIKERYPGSFLAVLVAKETEAIVRGNPYVDRVIVYDKKGEHRSWWRTARFGFTLKRERFDVAVNLHPTNRVNFISYFAQIPIRIGYRRKSYAFLTHSIEDKKWQGKRHEADYNFDLLALIDVPKPGEFKLCFPLRTSDLESLRNLVPQLTGTSYVVFHPSASSSSKIWAPERLAQVADCLARKYGVLSVIIGEGAGVAHAVLMEKSMTGKALNLAGRLTLGMLAWLLREARLLISNDSGPVHIASAVATPVISIFGRNQAGLSPIRWRPLSRASSFLQKDVGCVICLADRCQIDFKCLKELKTDEVLEEVTKYETYLVSQL